MRPAAAGIALIGLVAGAAVPPRHLTAPGAAPAREEEPRCTAKTIGEIGVEPIPPPTEEDLGDRLLSEALTDVYSAGKIGFFVKFKDDVNPYSIMSLTARPGESIPFEVLLGEESHDYAMEADGGTLLRSGERSWTWRAPASHGLCTLQVLDRPSDVAMTFHVFVLQPFPHASTTLRGYRIGTYPARPFRGDPAYARPPGFIEVVPGLLGLELSPHFRLRQFMCKQDGGWPRYLLINPRLLLKLEFVLEEVDKMGIPAQTLSVLSGFRTPYYNKRIGNTTTYSRHGYGDAADVFVDVDGDGRMDDLDGDGRVSIRDAQLLAGIIDSKLNEAWYKPFIGGLGIYGATSNHGPFVHMDVRGYKARW